MNFNAMDNTCLLTMFTNIVSFLMKNLKKFKGTKNQCNFKREFTDLDECKKYVFNSNNYYCQMYRGFLNDKNILAEFLLWTNFIVII